MAHTATKLTATEERRADNTMVDGSINSVSQGRSLGASDGLRQSEKNLDSAELEGGSPEYGQGSPEGVSPKKKSSRSNGGL